ncbi:Hint domain-containing protein [Shimia sp. MMG029]|uniref:Hint domain-containing protein n=1 Tax=Shimia sp. MMG029 TaxID=3021978 RepID=UPI0022FE4F59|nr:Hint domain-containing protein [Shimia sp. MMG029]MDA5557401.1 Hint domain-containing protein [Shimia sp. MMG029]
MSWVSLLDHSRALYNRAGLAKSHQMASASATLSATSVELEMPRGSLVLEMQSAECEQPQTMFALRTGEPNGLQLSLQAVPGGGLILVINRGQHTCHAAINLDTLGRSDVLRITYSWDLKARLGRLSVEQPGTFRMAQRAISTPVGLRHSDFQICTKHPETHVLAEEVSYVAVSDRIEPIGPMPSLSLQTPIMTDRGYRSAGSLKRGDVVKTANGMLVPVLANIIRTVPAAGLFAPVRLRAPFLGLTQDIVTSHTQNLVLGGSRVEYMFGTEHVLIPAGHLLHGNAATHLPEVPLATYCQLLLPNHAAVMVAGTFLESLDIGRIRRKPDLLKASMLSDYPKAKLPEHSQSAYPVLREFDALTLAEQRAA